jgi:hypothetical protein
VLAAVLASHQEASVTPFSIGHARPAARLTLQRDASPIKAHRIRRHHYVWHKTLLENAAGESYPLITDIHKQNYNSRIHEDARLTKELRQCKVLRRDPISFLLIRRDSLGLEQN